MNLLSEPKYPNEPSSLYVAGEYLRPSEVDRYLYFQILQEHTQWHDKQIDEIKSIYDEVGNAFDEAGLVRKTGEPYKFHPFSVAMNNVTYFGSTDPDQTKVDLLHDGSEDIENFYRLPEDQREGNYMLWLKYVDISKLAVRTNSRVAKAVSCVSKPIRRKAKKDFDKDEKTLYRMIKHAKFSLYPEVADLVVASKIADRDHNLRTSSDFQREESKKYETQVFTEPELRLIISRNIPYKMQEEYHRRLNLLIEDHIPNLAVHIG